MADVWSGAGGLATALLGLGFRGQVTTDVPVVIQ